MRRKGLSCKADQAIREVGEELDFPRSRKPCARGPWPIASINAPRAPSFLGFRKSTKDATRSVGCDRMSDRGLKGHESSGPVLSPAMVFAGPPAAGQRANSQILGENANSWSAFVHGWRLTEGATSPAVFHQRVPRKGRQYGKGPRHAIRPIRQCRRQRGGACSRTGSSQGKRERKRRTHERRPCRRTLNSANP